MNCPRKLSRSPRIVSKWLNPGIVCLVISLACLSLPAAHFPPDFGRWPVATPESQGLSASRLEAAPAAVPHGMGRMIVIRNGYDVWHYGGDPYARKTGWASVGRSLLTMVYGEMIMDGTITGGADALEKPVNALPCAEAVKFRDDVLLKHLLSYTSCGQPPGSKYRYHCDYFSMYRIAEQIDGRRPGIRMVNLGRKIGADWTEYRSMVHKDPGGSPFLTISSTEADAARWIYLWMHQGKWRDEVIVPAWFVQRSLEPMPSPLGGFADENQGWQIHTNRGGGFGEIIPRDAFWKTGGGRRLVFCSPSLRLIFAQTIDPSYDVRATAEAIIQCIVDRTGQDRSRSDPAREAHVQ
jgi:hypothetical protein